MKYSQEKTIYKRRRFLISTTLLLISINAGAQDKAPVIFGKVDKNDFIIQSPLVNENTNAVIIADVGTTKFEGNDKGWFSYVFKRQKRIKIIDKKSAGLGTIAILLYRSGDGEENLKDISAVTYNLEDGKVVETKLGSKDVFTEKADKNHFYKKFTFPNVQAGSILEFTYTVKSDFIYNLPSWQFQDETYPVLWSEFNVVMPGLLSYMSFFQGFHKFFINKSTNGSQSYSVKRKIENSSPGHEQTLSVSSPVVKQKWVIKDLEPFEEEIFLASPNNYMDKISFQLYKTYDGERFHDVANNWKTVNEQLMMSEDFGLPIIENTDWLETLTKKVTGNTSNDLAAAQKIYYYVQDNYTCTNRYEKYIKTTLQDVVKKKSGNVGELNLLLVALLKRRFKEVFPVLLSTTEYGRNSKAYPELERLNYVVSKLKIGATEYMLDASVPFLPFGSLPANCFNGHARVISEDTLALDLDANLQKETNVAQVILLAGDNNEMLGTYRKNFGLYESVKAKAKIARSLVDFKNEMSASFREELLIDDVTIDSLKEREDPVSVKVDFRIKASEDADIIYFNPVIAESRKNNPFHAGTRKYPVEMPYTTNDTYFLNMEIPKGYRVEELPKSARISFNATEGLFEYLVQVDKNFITLRINLQVNKAGFSHEDYQALRDFYGFIVKKHTEQIVFKKIK
jgi:hypothetical protein